MECRVRFFWSLLSCFLAFLGPETPEGDRLFALFVVAAVPDLMDGDAWWQTMGSSDSRKQNFSSQDHLGLGVGNSNIFWMFTPKIGEMIHFDEYVSNGLKPPTTCSHFLGWAFNIFGKGWWFNEKRCFQKGTIKWQCNHTPRSTKNMMIGRQAVPFKMIHFFWWFCQNIWGLVVKIC